MKGVTYLLLVNTIIFASFQTGRAKKYEIQGLDAIFKDYEKGSRPWMITIQPSKLISVSLYNKYFKWLKKVTTMNLWRSLFWKDDFLKWNPDNYGNISQVYRNNKPMCSIFLSLFFRYPRFVVKFGHQIVSDVLPMVVKSTCNIDITWFHFVEQKCLLVSEVGAFLQKNCAWNFVRMHPTPVGMWVLWPYVACCSWAYSFESTNEILNFRLVMENGDCWKWLLSNLQFDPYIPDELFVIITSNYRNSFPSRNFHLSLGTVKPQSDNFPLQ